MGSAGREPFPPVLCQIGNEGDIVEHPNLTAMIDEALDKFRSRELVSSSEVIDFLLDLRLATFADTEAVLDQILRAENEPSAVG